MFRRLKARLQKGKSVNQDTDDWMGQHGPYAYRLAGERAMDAYFLGDFHEQERWHAIRETILDRELPEADVEAVTHLLIQGRRDEP